jgi:hypothetical protein
MRHHRAVMYLTTYIRWAFGWVVRKETGGFTGDGVLGVDKACHGCQVGAYCVEGVPDVVTENLLVVEALK